MSTELSKTYEPAATEREIAAMWAATDSFHAEPTDPGRPYSIVIPPPNVTAQLHLGHALNNTLQDILIRQHRMMGENTVWLPGTDHAGIATQTVVEKRVLAEEGKRRVDFPREEFVAKIQAWKDEYEKKITNQLIAMGCSCDFARQAFTMDEPRAAAVREAFFQLFKDGLIYRGKRLVNWDPVTQTALADDEVEMEEVDGFFYYLKYPLEDGSGHVTVATTRPETMLGDTAVAINPKDSRAAALRGKKIRLPMVGRIIPIVEDDYVVMPDPEGDDPKAKFATGFLKVTPAHDTNDYDLGQRHKLPVINIFAPDATISDKHGWTDVGEASFLIGLSREAAREQVVEWFRRNGLLDEVKPYRHAVGHSYRSHAAIEPYLSDQWYCKVTDPRLTGAALNALAEDQSADRVTGVPPVPGDEGDQDALNAAVVTHGRDARDTGMRFYPARYAKTFQQWQENIRDWCISRQLWWGHRIPVWSKTYREAKLSIGETEWLPSDGKWKEFGAVEYTELRHLTNEMVRFVCPPSDASASLIAQLENDGFVQDSDVLDTWFSSALWPMSTLGWPVAAEAAIPGGDGASPALSTIYNRQSTINALSVWNPTSVLCTAREIITLWVSRMTMFNLYFLGRIPFEHVYIHPLVMDGEGRKMSKSLGNGVDPLDIIASHGTDAMRLTLTSIATNTQDVRMPVERDAATGRNTSLKFDGGRNFCNKLWNAARFVMMQAEKQGDEATKQASDEAENPSSLGGPARGAFLVDESKWSVADCWIVSRFNRAASEASIALSNYRFDQYAKTCYEFFWRDFCDWYLEAAKPAMKDIDRSPQVARILVAVLDGALRLMHPMIPFITEKLWRQLNVVCPERGIAGRLNCPKSETLIRASWPTDSQKYSDEAEQVWPRLQEVIIAIRNVRNDYKMDPKKPVAVSIRAAKDLALQLLSHQPEIELLATCRFVTVSEVTIAPAESTKTSAAGCDIYLEGMIDKAAEAQRSSKRRDELSRERSAMKGRLANAGYLAKAPPHLVKQSQDQLAAVEAELRKLGWSEDN